MRFNIIPFEERILLDAAGAANVVNTYEAQHATDQAQHQAQQQQQHADNPGAVVGNSDAVDGRILVVSSQVADHALLADAAKDGVTVITYDFNTSLADLAQAIADKASGKEISSIGFAMLGADGTFSITSDTVVTLASLTQASDEGAGLKADLAGFFKEVGSLIKNGGSIDILACNVAANTEGLQLIHQIDNLVDSANHDISVNASTDATGNASYGLNWQLEVGNVNAVDRYFDADHIGAWDGALDSAYVKNVYFTAHAQDRVSIDLQAYANAAGTTILTDPNPTKPGTQLLYEWNFDPSKYAWQQTGIAGYDTSGTKTGFNLNGSGDGWIAPGSAGTFTLYYRVQADFVSGTVYSNVGKIVINVLDTAPVSQNASITTSEDTSYSGKLYGSDIDAGQTLKYTASKPAHGTITLNSSTGAYIYKPDANYYGTDSFTYTVSDGTLTSTSTISVKVNSVNDAPIILSTTKTSYTMNEDGFLTMHVKASDVDSTRLYYTLHSGDHQVGGGYDTGGGTIWYKPAKDYYGTDSVTMWVSDGYVTTAVKIDITILPVNDAPVAQNASGVTAEDTSFSGIVKATDVDSTKITYSLTTPPLHGTVALDPTTGAYVYTPLKDYNGPDSFIYSASDGSLSSKGVVSLTVTPVNDAPVVVNPTLTLTEDTPINIAIPELGSDVDGNPLTITITNQPLHGTLTQNADGTVTYNPNADFNGTDAFSFTLNDGSLNSTVGTVSLIIAPENDAPVGNAVTNTTLEDTPVTGQVSWTDADSSSFTVRVGTEPQHGTVTMNSDGTYSYTPAKDFNGTDSFTYIVNDGQADGLPQTVTINVTPVNDAPVVLPSTIGVLENTTYNGTLVWTDPDSSTFTVSVVNQPQHGTLTMNNDGTYSYTPDSGYFGSDGFTVIVSDGQLDSAPQSVAINIGAVDDPPVVSSPSLITAEDTSLTILPATLGSDVDSSSFSVTIVTPPQNGSLTVNSDGTVTYVPNSNFNGSDSFRYILNDGNSDSASVGTATIQVAAVNDAPVPANPTLAVAEDGTLHIPSGQLGSDLDGDTFGIVITQQPANGTVIVLSDGSVSYQPGANFNGSDSFSYILNDGTADSVEGVANIVVAPVNDAPVAISPTIGVDENTPATILVAQVGTDVDGDPLTLNIETQPANGTLQLQSDGSIIYTPNAGYNGTDSFTYSVNDGTTNSNIGTVTLAVAPINDVPMALNPTVGVQEDGSVTLLSTALGSDVDGDALTINIINPPANGTLVVSDDGSSVTYVPNPDYNGVDSFSYTVSDGVTESSSGMVSLVVSPVNDVPTAAEPTFSVPEDNQIVISAGQLGNDVDGDPLQISIVKEPEHGSLVQNADGTFTYVPGENYNGTDSFTYTVSDGTMTSEVGTAMITVTPVNDAPTASSPTLVVNEDGSLQLDTAQLGNDIDGDVLHINIITQPANGTLVVNADGTVTYQPNKDFNGVDSFAYTVADQSAQSAIGTATITVNPVNDAPVATSPTLVLAEDTALNLTPDQLGTDVEGDPLQIVITTPPQHGTLIQNSDGSITFQPDPNYNGTDTFSYTVTDGSGNSGTGTVTLIVAPVNDAPDVTVPTVILDQNTEVTIPVSNLGTDVDGDSLSTIITQPPAHGSLVVNPDGSITYIPTEGFSGTDTISYQVTDGHLTSGVGTIKVVVNPEAATPVQVDEGNPASTFNPPPGYTGGGVGIPNVDATHLDPIQLGNPLTNDFGGSLKDHYFEFFDAGLLKKDVSVDSDVGGKRGVYQGGGEGDTAVSGIENNAGIVVDGESTYKIGSGDDQGSDRLGGSSLGDDLSKMLFFLGPISQKADYAIRSNSGNLLRTRRKDLFRYRERRKIKKFSDLIEMLGLADLSFKRKTTEAIQMENLNTVQRNTLEKNLDPNLFGEEHLKEHIKQLGVLSRMEVTPEQFPIVEALAVELLTKYIAAQDLAVGTEIPFPARKQDGIYGADEYVVEQVFSLGSSEIPVYLLISENAPPLLIFRGTKLGFKKVAEVRSIIENFNSKGPARVHYNNFMPAMKAFFNEWFARAPQSSKFRIFGYSQGGVLGQRAIVDFPEYVQAGEKYPSIFFNSPGVEEDYYKKWKDISHEKNPAVINYVITGDAVSKIGTGFIGEVFEISPKEKKDILESHFGMKFVEEDWQLFQVDAEAETKSETRAMLNAIQTSILTTELYKIASAGVEKLYSHMNKGFAASKAIPVIKTDVEIPVDSRAKLSAKEISGVTDVSGHLQFTYTLQNAEEWSKDSLLNNKFQGLQKKALSENARMNLINTMTDPGVKINKAGANAVDCIDTPPSRAPVVHRTRRLDVSFEADVYSQADMSTAALAIAEDLRDMIPESEGAEYKILDAVKEERKIDHLNL